MIGRRKGQTFGEGETQWRKGLDDGEGREREEA